MTVLTATESGAQRLQNIENRAAKCKRCVGRGDLKRGGYVCMFGRDALAQMQNIKNCDRFILREDQSAWLA